MHQLGYTLTLVDLNLPLALARFTMCFVIFFLSFSHFLIIFKNETIILKKLKLFSNEAEN